MATAGALSKTRPHVARSPGRDPELLPHQSTLRCSGSHQRQHQNPSSKGPRLHKSRLSAPESSTHGGHKDRIHRSSESSLKCGSLRILVQNPFFIRRHRANCWSPRREGLFISIAFLTQHSERTDIRTVAVGTI